MRPPETGQAGARLEYQVFNAKRPGINPDVPPGYESLLWVANSTTLICGSRDAVLVDTFFTLDHSVKLVDEIGDSGKNLTHIYITHGHRDHFFGINTLKRRFPNVRAVATASVVDRIDNRLAADMQLLRGRFPGQIPDDPGIPESLDGASIELEGHPLVPIETGHTDTADSTSLHVPSIGLIAAGDVVYNGIHPCLAETNAQSRLEWIDALDKLDALAPRAVVAGHKIPDHEDDPRHIAETRRYLRDFIRLDQTTDTPRALFRRDDRALPRPREPRVILGRRERRKEGGRERVARHRDDGGTKRPKLKAGRRCFGSMPTGPRAAMHTTPGEHRRLARARSATAPRAEPAVLMMCCATGQDCPTGTCACGAPSRLTAPLPPGGECLVDVFGQALELERDDDAHDADCDGPDAGHGDERGQRRPRGGEREHAERDLEQAQGQQKPPVGQQPARGERSGNGEGARHVSHAPKRIATASTPGPGHAMITIPVAIDSRPVTTLARRTRASMPVVRASTTPWKMNSAPMNVASSRIVQSMLKTRIPATTSSAPFEQQHRPVARHLRGGGAGELVADVGGGVAVSARASRGAAARPRRRSLLRRGPRSGPRASRRPSRSRAGRPS
jgi:glyoxylase-like metal-dependent hydrolase (beta-lactamase superfamily II)